MSDDGTLYYARDEGTIESDTVVAQNLEGERTPLVSFSSEEIHDLSSSPDGSRLAMTVLSVSGGLEADIWLVDVDRDIPSLLTTEAGGQFHPLWSPDGQWVYYLRRSKEEEGEEITEGVCRRRSDFGGEPEQVCEIGPQDTVLRCFNPEGTRLFIESFTDGTTRRDLMVINLEDEVTIEPWLATRAGEFGIALSPNGRWAAYLSSETGRNELYVRSITGQQQQRISTNGASRQPIWSPDGAMLYYQDFVDDDQGYTLQAVTVTSGHEIVEDGAEPSDSPFEWEPAGTILELGTNNSHVSMHPDGQRFIMVYEGDADAPDSYEIHVIQNFFEILKERASTKF